jgi:FkbM family methyltransferase
MPYQLALTREALAHGIAGLGQTLSPWWRFRLWARLAGPSAYASMPLATERSRRVWPHNFVMSLRESDWMERYPQHSGRYYQDDLICLLLNELRPGETFVDIGANLGFVTLTAASRVGPDGKVIAIEANPALTERLGRTVEQNGIANVEIIHTALGDRDGVVSLLTDGHHGTSHIDPARGEEHGVPLRRGDDLLQKVRGPVFIKIDVEGAEQLVLAGLPEMRARPDVRWLVEISASQLARFSTIPESVFELMKRDGYKAYSINLSPLSRKTVLKQIERPLDKVEYDVLFMR